MSVRVRIRRGFFARKGVVFDLDGNIVMGISLTTGDSWIQVECRECE